MPKFSRNIHLFRAIFVSALFLAWPALAQSPFISVPDPYQPPVMNWGQLPEGRTWGSVAGTYFDSKGNLWVFERCGGTGGGCADSNLDPILEFNPATGKLLKSFGAGLFVEPHAIFIDAKDNVWVADQAARPGKGATVVEFSPDGKVLLTLGTPGVTGDPPNAFNTPTGVVVAKNGDIFVSDGHSGNKLGIARVVKFSKDGKYLMTWGGQKGNDLGQMSDVHCIAMDSQGRIFVCDRRNDRVSIFDQNGKFIDAWKQFGIPSDIYIDKNDVMYAADNLITKAEGKAATVAPPEFARGIAIGSAKDGKVTGFILDPDQDPKDASIGAENMAAQLDGTLYAGDVDRKMMKKYVKK
jgi:hypothetical protein